MIFHKFKNVTGWTWKDLNEKIVKVIYAEANPDTMEPAMLGFHDITAGVTYLCDSEALRTLRTKLKAAGISVNELEKEVEYFKRKLHGQKENWLYTFAGQAMQGVLAGRPDLSAKSQIEYAVMRASALLAELEKETT